MAYQSAPDDLALHGVRVLGFPTTTRLASRYQLDTGAAEEALLDFEARGWVRRLSFAGSSGLVDDRRQASWRTSGGWPPSWTGLGPATRSARCTPRSGH